MIHKEMLQLTKEEKELIALLELKDKRKLAKFLIDIFSCAFQSITNDLQELKALDLINSVSKIKSAQKIRNFSERNDYIPPILLSLSEGLEELIAKTQLYAKEIEKIDKTSLWKRVTSVFAKLSIKADNYSILARKSLDAVIVGMSFVEYIKANKLCSKDYFSDVDSSLTGLIDFFDSRTCLLLNEYDPSNEEYWLKIGAKLSTMKSALIECNDDIFNDDIEIEF